MSKNGASPNPRPKRLEFQLNHYHTTLKEALKFRWGVTVVYMGVMFGITYAAVNFKGESKPAWSNVVRLGSVFGVAASWAVYFHWMWRWGKQCRVAIELYQRVVTAAAESDWSHPNLVNLWRLGVDDSRPENQVKGWRDTERYSHWSAVAVGTLAPAATSVYLWSSLKGAGDQSAASSPSGSSVALWLSAIALSLAAAALVVAWLMLARVRRLEKGLAPGAVAPPARDHPTTAA
jgi:hypothetical protein